MQSASAFDLQQPPFRLDATNGREATGLAASRDHPMTRHDDRERIAPECLPDRSRQGLVAEASRDLAISQRLTRGDRACFGVHATIEVGQTEGGGACLTVGFAATLRPVPREGANNGAT